MGIGERLENHYAWVTDPPARREVLQDVGRVLGVDQAAMGRFEQFFDVMAHHTDDQQVVDLGPGVADAAEQVLAGLARRGLGPRNVGADPAQVQELLDVVRRTEVGWLALQPDDGEPLSPAEQAQMDEFQQAFNRLEGTQWALHLDRDELRAVQQVAKDCTPQTRKRIFGTSNGVAIGAMLRTAMAAYNRSQRTPSAVPPKTPSAAPAGATSTGTATASPHAGEQAEERPGGLPGVTARASAAPEAAQPQAPAGASPLTPAATTPSVGTGSSATSLAPSSSPGEVARRSPLVGWLVPLALAAVVVVLLVVLL